MPLLSRAKFFPLPFPPISTESRRGGRHASLSDDSLSPPPLRFSAGETFEGRGLMNSGKGALPPLQSLLEVKLI